MYGELLAVNKKNDRIELCYHDFIGVIKVMTPSIIRIYSAKQETDYISRAIEHPVFQECNVNISQSDDGYSIETDAVTVSVSNHFKIDIYNKKGKLLCSDYLKERKPFIRNQNEDTDLLEAEGHHAVAEISHHKIEVMKSILGDEKFYGLGENTAHLNKRSYSFEMWNTDDPSPHNEGFSKLYKSIPFTITLGTDICYGLFFDNPNKAVFDMGKENSAYYFYGTDNGELDYYFIYGETPKEVLKGYTDLTGTTPLPQLWSLGYQQCRWSYHNKKRLNEIAETMRENDIPCDVLYLDIDYMDGYRVFTIDKNKFPDFNEMTDELKKKGFKVVTIIDPGVKKDDNYSVYREGIEKGYFAVDKAGTPYINKVWPGESAYPDFTDKKVRDWWAENQKFLIDAGVSGVWNDMNEPASFNGPLPDEVYFKNDGHPTDHRSAHNVYGQLMSKASYEGWYNHTNKRPFVITRACYAGIQKYSTVWTGDNQSYWEHLRLSVPMLLSLGMSGVSFAGTDVGGFSHDCTPELLSRWVQLGCFTPLFRNHSCAGTRDQEPWAFDEKTLDINRKYIKLRYKLIPYIYDLFREGEKSGLPIMRPLMLEFPDDINTHEINDQFMAGESILVAPILQQGQHFRAVYLPEGEWYDYWTGEKHSGKSTIVKDAPLDVCPIFIKSGSIIPNYPAMHYIGEKKTEHLILDIYPGKGNYTHYMDDGESFNYRNGEYNSYHFNVCDNEIEIAVGTLGYKEKYSSFTLILKETRKAYWNGSEVEIKNGCCTIPCENGKLKLKG